MTRPLVIANARIVDPATNRDAPGAVLVENGRIAGITNGVPHGVPDGAEQLDARGLVVAPGLIDMRVFTGEPGHEYRETLATARIPGVPEPGVNDLVIHQQDIQAVVNALWRGGAEGIQVMDQRLIATSAVRCVGNTLLLQGRVYSPPYVIRAVGKTDALRSTVEADPTIQNYLQYVAAYGLGWKVQESGDLTVPGYQGSVDLSSAGGR